MWHRFHGRFRSKSNDQKRNNQSNGIAFQSPILFLFIYSTAIFIWKRKKKKNNLSILEKRNKIFEAHCVNVNVSFAVMYDSSKY